MNNIKLYKSISLDIIKIFEDNKLEELESLMSKREKILKEEINNKIFKESLIAEGITDIDTTIKKLIDENLTKIKQEIKEHILLKQASNSYIYTNKEKINIFNEKV